MRLLLVATLCFFAASCSRFAKVQKSTDYEYKLQMADKYYEAGKYHNAQVLYQELFPIYKGGPKFEELFYRFAYCSYNLRDWLQAENLFKQFTEVFPNSPRTEEMEYMRAYTFYRQSPKQDLDQTNTLKAIGLLQAFINTHPGSSRNEEAARIIEELRAKLEAKDCRSALLYYDMRHYRAAAIALTSLINNFPDTQKGDEYKLLAIKSYYLYAENSIESRKVARYEQVIDEVNDFVDRYPDSPLLPQAQEYATLAQNQIKQVQHEQVTSSN